MATISSVGISGSGADATMVSKLVALERAPLAGLASKASKLTTQISDFGKVQSQVASLTDVASRIAQATAWTARNASSSNLSAATVTATSTADATSFTLDVDQLAKPQSLSSPTVTAGSLPGAGTLKIRLGSWNAAGTSFTNAPTALAGSPATAFATVLVNGDITINGSPIGAIPAAATAAERGQQISTAINAISSSTQVSASYNSITGAVALVSATGADIVLATTASATTAATGLGASGTVTGDVSISVLATDTVATISAKINAGNTGLQATAFNDGSFDRLLLRSKSTGTAAGFRIQSSELGLQNFVFDPDPTHNPVGTGMASQTVQYGLDAKARINGLAVTSGSNTLSGNIPGVTINLLATTTTNFGLAAETRALVSIGISEDVTPAVRNVSDLVTAYNNLNSTLNELTKNKFDSTLQKRVYGTFQGDTSVLSLISAMRNTAGSTSLGATSQYLSDVGVQMQLDGSLTINNAKLTVAANNGTNMQKLFTSDNNDPRTNGFALKFKALGKGLLAASSLSTKGLQPGQGVVTAKAAKLQTDLERNAAAQRKVSDHALDVEDQLTKRFVALDRRMGSIQALSNYVNQQITLWNKNTA